MPPSLNNQLLFSEIWAHQNHSPLSLQCKLWPRLLSDQLADEPVHKGCTVLPSSCPSHQGLETPCHRQSQLLPEMYTHNKNEERSLQTEPGLYCSEWKGGFTWMVRTILLVSSRAAMAVDVPKEAVPLWNPRTIRPSFLYCSMGSQTKSLNPWTEHIHH